MRTPARQLLLAVAAALVVASAPLEPAAARGTQPPPEVTALQAAPPQGGVATFSLRVPGPPRRCALLAPGPGVLVAKASFTCPSATQLRGAWLPANPSDRRQRWWLRLVVRDRAGRASAFAFSLEAKSAAWPGRRGLPRVGVVGDSITNMAEQAMVALLGARYALRVDGRNGYLIGQQLATLRSTLRGPRGPADAVVAELGTNNVTLALLGGLSRPNPALPGLATPTVSWRRQLASMVGELRGAPCALLVNVTTSTSDPAFNAEAGRVNAAIAAAVARHRRLHLVDWAGALAAHPSWYGHGNLLAEIHPTAEGQRGLAELVDAGLSRWCHLAPR